MKNNQTETYIKMHKNRLKLTLRGIPINILKLTYRGIKNKQTKTYIKRHKNRLKLTQRHEKQTETDTQRHEQTD
jgi:hypothetical protein